ncbi:MAG: hypothetical protein HC853_10490 [Anaerolineae bacterium]|nr:hypothetical protein [Anaerolineae bacterium]
MPTAAPADKLAEAEMPALAEIPAETPAENPADAPAPVPVPELGVTVRSPTPDMLRVTVARSGTPWSEK